MERRGDQGGACGADAVSSFGHRNDRRKLIIERNTSWPWAAAKHQIPHNNQPKTCRGNDGGIENDERLAGAQGDHHLIDFEGIEFGGNEKIK